MGGAAEELLNLDPAAIARRLASVDSRQVRRTLDASRITPLDAPVLFSEAAAEQLERMAQRAHAITLARFGRTITLYAPLYLSNHCVNHCTYCGFSADRSFARRHLSPDEARSEWRVLRAEGIRHLLLVTGEAPGEYGLDALLAAIRALRSEVASLSVEVFPSDRAGYAAMAEAGVDGLVLYQETYDRARYLALHPRGPKSDFERRLRAVDHGGAAGFRSLGIGALLGLTPARVEACLTAWHGAALARCHPKARLAVSFPRLRPVPGGTPVLHPIADRDLVQFIVGMRLIFPDAELVLSTRESARLRDHLLPLGITRLSAGSKTAPGAYGQECDPGTEQAPGGQFETDDRRSVAEVIRSVQAAGFDAVTKDFDPVFVERGEAGR